MKNITDEDINEYNIATDRLLSETDIPYDSVLCDRHVNLPEEKNWTRPLLINS